jgi:iron-sulfur cluster repair protein YtfE (RIC family)
VQGTKRGRWALALLAGVGVAAVASNRLRARSAPTGQDEPADVSFMLAIHAALRRDLSRLRADAGQLDSSANHPDGVPATVLAGWDAFRAELDNHHSAEDDDLWPVLRPQLSDAADLAAVDAMVEEHRRLPEALAAVDAAIRGDGELTQPVELLATLVLDHLAHEEQAVVPLIEHHLSQAQWHTFMLKERRRLPPRQRPEFLTWILDDASEHDADVVLREIPAPGRLVYRRILRPRYQAEHRWLIPSTAGMP